MKKWILILTVLLMGKTGYGQDWPPKPDSLAVAQQIEIIDSLYKSVMTIYPLELLDSVKWKEVCERAKTSVHSAVRYSENDDDGFPYGCITQLGKAVGIQNLYKDWAIVIDQREIFISSADIVEKENTGRIIIGDAGELDMNHKIDNLLNTVKQTDGLLLDITQLGDNEKVVEHLIGRLFDREQRCLKTHKRIIGSCDYEDVFYNATPRGDWQYEKPTVVLVNSRETMPRYLMAYCLTKRPNTKLIGDTLRPPKGIYPILVNLGYGTYVEIPTAILQTSEGKEVRSITPDIYIKTYYDINLSLRARGEKELKKMMSKEKKRN